MRRKKPARILQQVRVEDYAAEGKSIARVDGKVIFIERVVPGDIVNIRLIKEKKDWAEGQVLEVTGFSQDRVDPFCRHFGVCGGCQWQMLPYEKQLEYKTRQVTETLKRIGKISLPAFDPILGSTETRRYRNKLEYTFGNKRYLDKAEILDESITSTADVAGFHARGFFDKVVNIVECHLQDEPTNAIRNAVREFAIQQGWTFYDIRAHEGFMRVMQVRLCTTGELMVNMVVGEDDQQKIDALMQFMRDSFPAITTLLYTVNTKWNDSIYDLKPVVVYGNGYVIEEMRDRDHKTFRFKIGPTSFFQTNTKQSERLYQITRDFAELSGKEVVYDLYCGTGSIGIFCSPLAKKIIGVEMITEAVYDARENAKLNGVDSALFFDGDVATICDDDFFAKHGRPDVIITDPPRAGMHEKLTRQIMAMNAPVVVYVSCNPATQARDLQLLSEVYEVTKVQPVDMFPHTHHIENVVQLKRKVKA